jgi:hypothetical protein
MFFVFIMLLLAGTTDIGTLLDDNVGVVYAARTGARTGAVIGPNAGADCAIIGAVHASLLNQPDLTPSQIIIYQSDANGKNTRGHFEAYPEPVTCSGGAIVLPNTATVVSPTTNTWPAASRNNALYFEDSLGVEIDFSYQLRFNLLGAGVFNSSDAAVFPLGPTSSS